MKEIDLELARGVLGKVSFKGKTYTLYEPTLKQTLQHENLRQDYLQNVGSLGDTPQDEQDKLIAFIEFLQDEVQIFVPEMDREIIEDLSETQRSAIMSFYFPDREAETQEEVEKKTSKPKKKGKSRGAR